MRTRDLACGWVIAIATLTSASCASVIGADQELADAANRLCLCITKSDPDLSQLLGSSTSACTDELSRRLENARTAVRADWLANYANVCSGACSVEGAEVWRDCFYAPPTCSQGGCDGANECCAFRTGETCEQNNCSGSGRT